jgi:hypothetical protein
MHSFSPLRFDPAKQMPFAVSKTPWSHAAVSIDPLEKNLRPASEFALSHCEAFRDLPTPLTHVAFRGIALANCPTLPSGPKAFFGS